MVISTIICTSSISITRKSNPAHESLAGSLSRVEKSAKEGIVRSQDVSRRNRERIKVAGYSKLEQADIY